MVNDNFKILKYGIIIKYTIRLYKSERKWSHSKTLKNVEKSSKYMQLKQIAQMTLGSGNMSLAVELPSG